MLEFQNKFIEEASELIEGIESELISLESNPDDKLIIDKIFRVMHTLKGTASMFGFNSIESITHQLETIYDLIRDDQLKISEDIVNTTFDTIDLIKKILGTKNKLSKKDQKLFNEILNRINRISGIHEETEPLSPNKNNIEAWD